MQHARANEHADAPLVAVTVRVREEVRDRLAAAAASHGLPLAAHAANLLAAAECEPVALGEDADNDERRARQLAALEAAGLLDEDAARALAPRSLPLPLRRAREIAARGGVGWVNFGRTLAAHVHALVHEERETIVDGVRDLPRDRAIEELTRLLGERAAHVLAAIPSARREQVLGVTIDVIAEEA